MPESPKIRFTPAQAAAISARGGSLLVSAAAGSGKTRVLVERVVGLITDPKHPVEADSLLIMTFTNAAAAKLRADISARLAEEVRAHPDDVRLRRQQLLLQRASIGTVDAFCLHFVQQHFAALDIPPDFETGEEAELARIEEETLADVLETAYTDPDFRAFADFRNQRAIACQCHAQRIPAVHAGKHRQCQNTGNHFAQPQQQIQRAADSGDMNGSAS